MNNAINLAEAKYGKDAPFNDPVVRCDQCNNLLFTEKLHVIGKCAHCGNRKVREVHHLTESEMQVLKGSNIDPDFIKMFEQQDHANAVVEPSEVPQ
jgi:hypothetical protein